ncbi:MAG: hypothetical protein AAGJ56_07980 [Myxococcota bacterium]
MNHDSIHGARPWLIACGEAARPVSQAQRGSRVGLCLLLGVIGVTADAGAAEVRARPSDSFEHLVKPDAKHDYSAYRVDSEVFGWNKDFSEVGCIGMELTRKPDSAQLGEAFLLVFKTDSVEPLHNVHTLYISQSAFEQPIPLVDVRDRTKGIDFVYRRMWPRKPKKKWYRGAMRVETVWEPVAKGDGSCEPAVGFILRWKGQKRFQPHHRLTDIRESCSLLRLTNQRVYWGRRDVAVALPRFDFGTQPQNEHSFRHPVSAVWSQARALKLVVRGQGPSELRDRARKVFKRFGSVDVDHRRADTEGLVVRQDLEHLGRRFARELGVDTLTVVEEGPDVVLHIGAPARPTPLESGATDEELATHLPRRIPPHGRRKRR